MKLVSKPEHQFIIGTKWVFMNKIDEFSVVVKNKVRLVVQWYKKKKKNWFWWNFCTCS